MHGPDFLPNRGAMIMVNVSLNFISLIDSEHSISLITPAKNVITYFDFDFSSFQLSVIVIPLQGVWCSSPCCFLFPSPPLSLLMLSPTITNQSVMWGIGK